MNSLIGRVRRTSDFRTLRGLFISSYTQRGSVLLHVDLEGNARALWQQNRSHQRIWAVPSPDGRHVAISGRSGNHNVWVIENF